MSDEPLYSRSSIAAVGCWSLTALLVACAWIAWAVDGQTHLALLLAQTGCALSAVSAVMNIRCMYNKLVGHLRVVRLEVQGLSRPEGGRVRGL